jgi:hypothetical protein
MSTNKKNLITSLALNFVSIILLIEHWCGLEAAIYVLCGWTFLSLIIHINILRDYIVVPTFVREDHTR